MTTPEQLIDMTEVEIVEYFEKNKFSMLEIFNIWKQIWYIEWQRELMRIYKEIFNEELLLINN